VLAVLFLAYVVNVMDRAVLSVLLEPIRNHFGASDTQLGLLGGLAFSVFYATMGIPIAALADRWSRRGVLAISIAVWSGMTALCGMAVNFAMLVFARIGTAIGEAGGSPPSHSLISDYFPVSERATALSIYALGIPIGAMFGNLFGGWGNEFYGWRMAFILVGLPGLLVALLVRFTIKEPRRGQADKVEAALTDAPAPALRKVFEFLWRRKSFRHMALACALHAFVWYGGSTFNAAFLVRSHGLTTGEVGTILATVAAIGAIGTFLGGYLADRLSVRNDDRRWYMWVPGIAIILMVPFQFSAYLAPSLSVVVPSFALMVVLGSMFFGPSFAVTQGLVTLRMRAVAASVLLFIQTLIGLGVGPFLVGVLSDYLAPTAGNDSLRYGLVLVGLANLWSAFHYFVGAKHLRGDFEATESVISAGR
jgi:MFS family permease